MKIKTFLNSNFFLRKIGKIIQKFVYKIKQFKYKSFQIDYNKILLIKPGPYGDNIKAIAENIHSNYPDIRLIWAYSDINNSSSFPDYIHLVKLYSDNYFKEISSSFAWISSVFLPSYIKKKSGQLYIQAWHGDKGFKKIGNDARADIKLYKRRNNEILDSKNIDFFITSCDHFKMVAKSAFGYSGPFIDYGLPRNDLLVKKRNQENVNKIKEKIGIDLESNVLLYAPTFRDFEKNKQTVKTTLDLHAVLKSLCEKYKNEWVCLVRAHDGFALLCKNTIGFKDVSNYPDMADLMLISDVLITDYSSCAGDFAIMKKLVLIYQDDYQMYIEKGRSLYFSLNESPYFTATNMNELLEIVNNVNSEDIVRNCENILNFYNSHETGESTEKVVQILLNYRGGK